MTTLHVLVPVYMCTCLCMQSHSFNYEIYVGHNGDLEFNQCNLLLALCETFHNGYFFRTCVQCQSVA